MANPRANTRYWGWPSGSRIAYSLYEPPAGVPLKREPIIFLHGGPGLRANDDDHRFYRRFTRDEFNVYLFDQAGSGFSNELPRAQDYTVGRFVSDLEATRKAIGAERVILIGHSWGGTLAAHYAVAYPDRVAKLVFHSPGPAEMKTFVPFEFDRTAARHTHGSPPPPRVFAALALSYVNVEASEHLVSQVELGVWELTRLDPGELVRKGSSNKLPNDFTAATMAGANMYPIFVTSHELKQDKTDIRHRLAQLNIPAIALYGQCDMIPWADHAQYKQSIPGLREFYFRDAGHYIDLSQPEQLAAVIRSFLLEQEPPLPPYTGNADPRPPAGSSADRFSARRPGMNAKSCGVHDRGGSLESPCRIVDRGLCVTGHASARTRKHSNPRWRKLVKPDERAEAGTVVSIAAAATAATASTTTTTNPYADAKVRGRLQGDDQFNAMLSFRR